jgi:protein O-mannosyl-transferase
MASKFEITALLKSWKPYAWLVLLGLILYGRTLSFGLTLLDDNILLGENRPLLSEVRNIPLIFQRDVYLSAQGPDVYYRPLLNCSYLLDTQLGCGALPVYHAANLAIHLAVVCALFYLLCLLGYARFPAFAAAAIFTVHPVLTGAVAWLPGRNDSLLTLMVLLALICYWRYVRGGRWPAYFGHLLFFALALLTKETALLFPLLILLALYLFEQPNFRRYAWQFLAGWLPVLTAYYWLWHNAMTAPLPPKIGNLLTLFPAVLMYLGKAILPLKLGVLPLLQPSGLLAGAAVLGLLLWAFYLSPNKDWRRIIFGAAWFLLFLLPPLVAVKPGMILSFSEHRIYLAFIGLIMVLLELQRAWQTAPVDRRQLALLVLILALFSGINWRHSQDYRDPISFWRRAVLDAPDSWFTNSGLANAALYQNQLPLAETALRRAQVLNNHLVMFHNNLGLIYLRQGKYAAAEKEFRAELGGTEHREMVLYNLQVLHNRQRGSK